MPLSPAGITVIIETVLELIYFVLIGYGVAIVFRYHHTASLIILSVIMGGVYAALFQGGRVIDAVLAGSVPDFAVSLVWFVFLLITIAPAAVILRRTDCSWSDAFIGGLYIRAVLLMLSVTVDPFVVGIYLNAIRR